MSCGYLSHGDAPLVGAGEFSFGAAGVGTSILVRVVAAIVLVIALPRLEDAAPVAATVLDGPASVERAVALVLVGIVATVVVAVAGPQARNALAVGAVKFVALASQIPAHAHPVVVHQLGRLVALALGRAVGRRVARLGASAVVERARIKLATLSLGRKHLRKNNQAGTARFNIKPILFYCYLKNDSKLPEDRVESRPGDGPIRSCRRRCVSRPGRVRAAANPSSR